MKFLIEDNKNLQLIINKFKENEKAECYLVGGCVRDFLLNENPHNFDFTTNLKTDEIKELFKDYTIINNNGEKYGTVTIRINNENFEITTYRSESDYDGRRPKKVEFISSIKKDLQRRDFTINAIAYNVKTNSLYDPFNGISDLYSGIIRTIGDPLEKFSEDYLRILRMLRFIGRFSFAPTRAIKQAAISLSKNIRQYTSSEKITSELREILVSQNIYNILIDYRIIFGNLFPSLKECFDFDQCSYFHQYTLYEHIAHVVEGTKPNFITRLAALFHDIGKPNTFSLTFEEGTERGHFINHNLESVRITSEILNKVLALNNKEKDELLFLIENHDFAFSYEKKTLKRLLSKTPDNSLEIIEHLLDLRDSDRSAHINIDKLGQLYDLDIVLNSFKEIKMDNDCLK